MKRLLSTLVGLTLVAGGLVASNPASAAKPSPDPALAPVHLAVPHAFKGAPQKAPTTGQVAAAARHKLPVANPPKIHPNTACASLPTDCFTYVGYRNTPAAAEGAVAQGLDIENPGLDGDDHSLAEAAVQSSDSKQIVEAGWTKDTAVCGQSTGPCLFVFHWVNGVPKGYNNTAGSGFAQCSAANCGAGFHTAGEALTASVGLFKAFGIQYDSASNAWWISYDGNWVGYYPATLWSGASPAVTFTSFGFYQSFGEIASQKSVACAKMGDGTKGSLGASGSPVPARLGSTAFTNPAVTPLMTAFDTDATRYDHVFLSSGTPPVFSTRSIYYGGDNTAC